MKESGQAAGAAETGENPSKWRSVIKWPPCEELHPNRETFTAMEHSTEEEAIAAITSAKAFGFCVEGRVEPLESWVVRAGESEMDMNWRPTGVGVGEMLKKGTLIITVHVGTAEDDTVDPPKKYEMLTSTTGFPIIKSLQSGRYYTLGWDEVLALAVTNSIDEDAPEEVSQQKK